MPIHFSRGHAQTHPSPVVQYVSGSGSLETSSSDWQDFVTVGVHQAGDDSEMHLTIRGECQGKSSTAVPEIKFIRDYDDGGYSSTKINLGEAQQGLSGYDTTTFTHFCEDNPRDDEDYVRYRLQVKKDAGSGNVYAKGSIEVIEVEDVGYY
jgi:hypothetical protein